MASVERASSERRARSYMAISLRPTMTRLMSAKTMEERNVCPFRSSTRAYLQRPRQCIGSGLSGRGAPTLWRESVLESVRVATVCKGVASVRDDE